MHHHKPGREGAESGEKDPRGHFELTRRITLQYGRDLWCLELEELRSILHFAWTIIGGIGHFKNIA